MINNQPIALRPETQGSQITPSLSRDVNRIMHFKQLSVGAGSSIFKTQGAWLWAGSAKPSSATFKINLPTGALTTIGTIDATGGTISGDLIVTGSLLSDDGATFQTKLTLGRLSFLKNGAEKGYIKVASDSSSLTIATGDKLYITKTSASPIIAIDQDSNVILSNGSAYIAWGSSTGRRLTATGSQITCDGDFQVDGGYKIKPASTVYSGASGTFTDADAHTIRVRGELITNFSE